MVIHASNPGTWEAKAGRPQVQGQPGLHSKTLSYKRKKKPIYLILVIRIIL
jgi:hypothetical protein